MRVTTNALLGSLVLLALTDVAQAQTFPADADYRPFRCGRHAMTDGRGDAAPFVDHRDLVGDTDHAAALHAADANFLYLRIRVDADPYPGGTIAGASWGVAIDKDHDNDRYDALAMVDGVTGQVYLYENTQRVNADDATDPAETPPVATYALDTHARSDTADTDNGGNDDFYVSFAIAWADLRPLGVEPTTRVRVWVASSDQANALTGDFACHSGAGGAGLSDGDADDNVLDPDVDSDGDGSSDDDEVASDTDPNDPDSRPGADGGDQLAGGGGCAVGLGKSGAGGAGGLLLLVGGLVAATRRRPRRPRGRCSPTRW